MQHKVISGNRNQVAQFPQINANMYGITSYPYQNQNQRMMHQTGGVAGIGNSYSTTSIYNSPPNNVQFSVAPEPLCNMSDEIQILPPIPDKSSITFRKLPFYELKFEMVKPSILAANHVLSLPSTPKTTANQEFHLKFVLNDKMASEIALNRDSLKNEYLVQVQLRMTAIDNANPPDVTEYDDLLPMGLAIRVNGRHFNNLPPNGPTTRQGVETRRIPRPITITPLVKLAPIVANDLVINWGPEPPEVNKTFVFTLNIVKKLTAEFLLDKLKERPKIGVDITKRTILQQYRRVIDDDDLCVGNADDDDVGTTNVRVSLICPLSKCRMKFPAKGANCAHLQCFDGSAFIVLNEKRPMWNCPTCSRALYYDDLLLDEYTMDILQNDQLSDCQEIQILVDGTWKKTDQDESDTNDQRKVNSTVKSSPGRQVSTEGVTENTHPTERASVITETSHDSGTVNTDTVVDLTLDDDKPEDETSETLSSLVSPDISITNPCSS